MNGDDFGTDKEVFDPDLEAELLALQSGSDTAVAVNRKQQAARPAPGMYVFVFGK